MPAEPSHSTSVEEGLLRIEVSGNSSISRRAERAILHVRVANNGPEQMQVSTDVMQSSKQLQAMLKELCPRDQAGKLEDGASVTHWSMSTLSTGSHQQYNAKKEENTRVFTANTAFEVKFADFGKLGSVATQLSTLPFISIDRIDWRLTDATRASFATQSRQRAVMDAVEKAKDFAAAVNMENVVAIEISDTKGGNIYMDPRIRAHYHGGGEMHRGPQDEGLSFEPENVDVTCGVQIVFRAF